MFFLLAGVGLFAVSSSVLAQDCAAGAGSDFDGDGLADLAIGDPDATVSGVLRAGSVHIAYGDGTVQSIGQHQIPDNDNAAGDRFGHAMTVVDWNQDGCSDLLVGTPFEDVSGSSLPDAGAVVFIPGSSEGLVAAEAQTWTQGSFSTGAAAEAGDQFGFSLTAGKRTNGTPFLVVGAPGEAVGSIAEAGMVIYATPSVAVNIHQDSTGVPGVVESGDLYGYSVASSPSGFVIGGPGEAIGTLQQAGTVHVFAHNGAASVPPVIGGVDQDSPGISGVSEAGDLFGYSVGMVDYKPTASTVSTLVTVGSPTEDTGAGDLDTGWVFELTANGSVVEKATLSQGSPGVDGAVESDDLFGSTLSLVNRNPGAVSSWEDLLLAVGAPGEDAVGLQPMEDRGGVQVFSMIGEFGDHDVFATSVLTDAGAQWRSDMHLGTWMLATADHLFVSDPFADTPVVFGLPWENLYAEAEDPVLVYTPADFGIDKDDVGSFGTSLA